MRPNVKTLLACCAALGVTSVCNAAAGATEPARWRQYALIVDLNNLPTGYSCDDLWYKFRDVLKVLGARADMKVTPYRCGPGAGALARSPRVELFFRLPEALSGDAVRWRDMEASQDTVSLRPGAPASITGTDCELMRQIKGALLSSLPVRVLSYRLTCVEPPRHEPHFTLTVQTLKPVVAATALQKTVGSAPAKS